MKTDIQQNNLIIADIAIPLLASESTDMEVTVPDMFRSSYIYHVSRRDEAHLLRRTLINGLLPEHRICKKMLVDAYNKKINHPEHLQKFGKAFLQSHQCIMPNGTTKNCWDAYKNGDFIALGRKAMFSSRILPKIGSYIFLSLLAAACLCSCVKLLGHPIDILALIILYYLTALSAIPFMQRIRNCFEEVSSFILPGVLMISGAILNIIVPFEDQNAIMAIWTSLGSIGTILFLGIIGIYAAIMSFMCMLEIFKLKFKYL